MAKAGSTSKAAPGGGDAASGGAFAGALRTAVRRILRPLVRLLITRGISFPQAGDILRGLYVEVAEDSFKVGDKRPTDSRVHLLTGVHRKDVRRLRAEAADGFSVPRKASLSSLIIARWTTLDEYRDEGGKARALPRASSRRDGEGNGEASFESLVRSINTDIRPRVVLDEWLHLGLVHLDDEDRVVLNVDAFVPPEASEELAYYFGRNVHDHLAAAVSNVLGEGEPLLERAVVYNRLTAASVAELREMAKEKGMETLRELNRRAMTLQRRDSSKSGADHRMNFGIYFYEEDEPAAPEAPIDDAPRD